MPNSFINYYLSEKRRNPDKNPYRSAWDVLIEYKDDPDVFISFTEVPKIGINPLSDFKTPIGIYTFPVIEFIEQQFLNLDISRGQLRKVRYMKSIGDYADFAGDRDYINFLRLQDRTDIIKPENYSSKDYENDIRRLTDEGFTENFSIPKTEIDVDNEKAGLGKTPFAYTWEITARLAKQQDKSKSAVMWNRILRKTLGWSGVVDRKKIPHIHPSERFQAVFFSREPIELISREENAPDKLTSGKALDIINDYTIDLDYRLKLLRKGVVNNNEDLKYLINSNKQNVIGEEAFIQVNDEDFVRKVATDQEYSKEIRFIAVQRVDDEDVLRRISRTADDGAIRKRAFEKLGPEV